MLGIKAETKFASICAGTEEELLYKLEVMKSRYIRVIEIHPKRRGCSAWIADVEVKEERK